MSTLRHGSPQGYLGPDQHLRAEHLYPAVPAAAPDARRLITGTLAEWGLADVARPAEQVAAELLANAVCQGERTVPAEILLRLTWSPPLVVIEVGDHGPGAPPPPPVQGMPWHAEHGRGLQIADALAEELAWYAQGAWTLVWAAFRLATGPGALAGAGQLGRAA